MMRKEIGKITSAKFGFGGYQGVMVCYTFHISGKGWGCFDVWTAGWAHVSEDDLRKPGQNYKWTHEERIKHIGEMGWKSVQLLKDAKVDSLDQLTGKPIEATFDDNDKLINFRILTEVL